MIYSVVGPRWQVNEKIRRREISCQSARCTEGSGGYSFGTVYAWRHAVSLHGSMIDNCWLISCDCRAQWTTHGTVSTAPLTTTPSPSLAEDRCQGALWYQSPLIFELSNADILCGHPHWPQPDFSFFELEVGRPMVTFVLGNVHSKFGFCIPILVFELRDGWT